MSYRTAAENAYALASEDDAELAKFGLSLLTDLANEECYPARLCMMYLYDFGGVVQQDPALAQLWAERAQAMHSTLSEADDLYDAGFKCMWDIRFMSTKQDAIAYWEKAASLGNGVALYAICDMTRNSEKGTSAWQAKLATAASLGSIQAMVELAEQDGLRETKHALVWLRAAAVLGSLRAKEMLE